MKKVALGTIVYIVVAISCLGLFWLLGFDFDKSNPLQFLVSGFIAGFIAQIVADC